MTINASNITMQGLPSGVNISSLKRWISCSLNPRDAPTCRQLPTPLRGISRVTQTVRKTSFGSFSRRRDAFSSLTITGSTKKIYWLWSVAQVILFTKLKLSIINQFEIILPPPSQKKVWRMKYCEEKGGESAFARCDQKTAVKQT